MTLDHAERWCEEYSDHTYDMIIDLARHLIGFNNVSLYDVVRSGHAPFKGHIVISLVVLHALAHTVASALWTGKNMILGPTYIRRSASWGSWSEVNTWWPMSVSTRHTLITHHVSCSWCGCSRWMRAARAMYQSHCSYLAFWTICEWRINLSSTSTQSKVDRLLLAYDRDVVVTPP